jgi:tetratricopeptide (TPR) repeat protein
VTRLAVLLGIAVLLPALLLAALGVRTLAQDRRLADSQVRERLDRAADRAAAQLQRELQRWESAVAQAPPGAASAERLQQQLRETLKPGSESVFLSIDVERIQAFPEHALLWEPGEAAGFEGRVDAARLPSMLAAERLELQQHDFPRAIAAYRRLPATSDKTARAEVLLRLARTCRKAGQRDQARAAYQDLERLAAVRVGGAPADLVAAVEL